MDTGLRTKTRMARLSTNAKLSVYGTQRLHAERYSRLPGLSILPTRRSDKRDRRGQQQGIQGCIPLQQRIQEQEHRLRYIRGSANLV